MNAHSIITFISSPKGIATIVVCITLLLKLMINIHVTPLRFVEMVSSIPGEIVILVMGYLVSAAPSVTKSSSDFLAIFSLALLTILLLMIIYGIENYITSRLNGHHLKRSCLIIFMYIIAIGLYILVVIGGKY